MATHKNQHANVLHKWWHWWWKHKKCTRVVIRLLVASEQTQNVFFKVGSSPRSGEYVSFLQSNLIEFNATLAAVLLVYGLVKPTDRVTLFLRQLTVSIENGIDARRKEPARDQYILDWLDGAYLISTLPFSVYKQAIKSTPAVLWGRITPPSSCPTITMIIRPVFRPE